MKSTAQDAHKRLATTIRRLRDKARLTQKTLAKQSGVGLRFVRELERGDKPRKRLDKVNQVLARFDHHLEAVKDYDFDA